MDELDLTDGARRLYEDFQRLKSSTLVSARHTRQLSRAFESLSDATRPDQRTWFGQPIYVIQEEP